MTRPVRARIDLSALQHNLSLACQAAPDSRVMAVIKAARNAAVFGGFIKTNLPPVIADEVDEDDQEENREWTTVHGERARPWTVQSARDSTRTSKSAGGMASPST